LAKKRKKKTSRKVFAFTVLILFSIPSTYFLYQKIKPFKAPQKFIPLPENFKSYGIDVSHHQAEINWDLVFQAPDTLISFVYCKATEGESHIDTQWKTNRKELLSRNKAHGAYHFYLPTISPTQQAKHFLNHYTVHPDDLPPVLDAEIEGESKEVLIEGMKEWLSIVEKQTGRRPIIYTSYILYRDLLKKNFPTYKFWVANYSKKEYRFKDVAILYWQYSDNGKVPGIKGEVDLNFSKINF